MMTEFSRRARRSKPENWSKSREGYGSLGGVRLALAGLESPLRLVDDVNSALATHDTVVAVATAERFQ
jgi:hypothetical protein